MARLDGWLGILQQYSVHLEVPYEIDTHIISTYPTSIPSAPQYLVGSYVLRTAPSRDQVGTKVDHTNVGTQSSCLLILPVAHACGIRLTLENRPTAARQRDNGPFLNPATGNNTLSICIFSPAWGSISIRSRRKVGLLLPHTSLDFGPPCASGAKM